MTPLERYHNNRDEINEKQKAYYRDVYYLKNRSKLLKKSLNQTIKRNNENFKFSIEEIPMKIKKNVTLCF